MGNRLVMEGRCESGERWRAELSATRTVARGLRRALSASNWVLHVDGWPPRTFTTLGSDDPEPTRVVAIVRRFLTDAGLIMDACTTPQLARADEVQRESR